MAFEPWDIVKVPFPYTDRPVRQNRPALVIAAESFSQNEISSTGKASGMGLLGDELHVR